MVEAQPFTVGASTNPIVVSATRFSCGSPVSHRWRLLVLAAILAVNAAVAIWLFLDLTQFLRVVQDGASVDLLKRLTQWRELAVKAVAGAGLVLALVTFIAFRFTERSWLKRAETAETEWERKAERWRTQLTEKYLSEEHLIKAHKDLESQISKLTRTNTELEEELNRRRKAERSLSAQRQQLEASKDVLQVHVQARAQELQKLQRQYELILNAAGEGICGVEPNGKITFVNPTAAKLMGLDVSRMVGRNESDLFGELAAQDTTTIRKDQNASPFEVLLKRPDGSTFTAEFERSQICENNKVIGRVILFRDITERKQSAQALELKAAELTRSNAELEQFAFVASHDLQEPLRKIRAFGDRLKMKCAQILSPESADYLDRMQNAAARMQTLINDLLTFSRVISRTEPFVTVDLAQVTREVLSDLEVRIEKTGATVEVNNLPRIQADPMQMRQLLQNLIGNALKFHLPDAKPRVKVNGLIVTNGSSDDPLCQLTVEDNGIGFDEKYIDKIFAVFQRLHGRQEYEGTGIGLAVCRRIVDRHKGNITARSKPGEGATFTVQLPVRSRLRPDSKL
ncbi:MAG TPA: ATP-binding protein [Verrucomicrobiae bacterium]|nr:ATP-binding protein [Verrucomicrobiae bacterium]